MLRDYLAGFVLLMVSSSVSAADHVTLTGKTLLDGSNVTVGDVFNNAGSYATHVLAPVPDVGKKLFLSKNDLQRVADAFHLSWDAPDADVSVALERNAVAVDAEALAAALDKSDLKDKISSDASFEITEPTGAIVLQGQSLPELTIADTAFDPATERFTALLKISRNGDLVKEVKLSGLATPMARVPVLANALPTNAIIDRSDIVEKDLPKRSLRPGTIFSAQELVGMSPKRMLQANQPVALTDVTPPLMVKRNELVTVTYRNGPILLSTKARAMANGTRGDIVTLMNVSSKKPFEAQITGPQQAEVLLGDLDS